MPVCRAIQHAHQKGVIHRDVKPSNVLVAIQDGRPVPKVIDFGVAKALHQRLADRTMYTELGAVIGTLEYMAPEQAELSALDVDTRADVYALGALLYELLTGSTPLDRSRLAAAGLAEMMRIIREEEPPKPSTRLSESTGDAAGSGGAPADRAARLTKEVRGDLDWIVMKCLEKDRTRRYETANGLARDIERHLADEPVEARPPSRGYRLRKFARRNKGRSPRPPCCRRPGGRHRRRDLAGGPGNERRGPRRQAVQDERQAGMTPTPRRSKRSRRSERRSAKPRRASR